MLRAFVVVALQRREIRTGFYQPVGVQGISEKEIMKSPKSG